LRRADSGHVLVGDGVAAPVDVTTEPRSAARWIGLAPQSLGIYPMLTVSQNLQVFGELAAMPRRRAAVRAREVAQAIGLDDTFDARASTLSGGQARRLHTGMALMKPSAVLFLDEPTVGGRRRGRQSILAVVRTLCRRGRGGRCTRPTTSASSSTSAPIVAILHEGSYRAGRTGCARCWPSMRAPRSPS